VKIELIKRARCPGRFAVGISGSVGLLKRLQKSRMLFGRGLQAHLRNQFHTDQSSTNHPIHQMFESRKGDSSLA
jgi:hypothetical protein